MFVKCILPDPFEKNNVAASQSAKAETLIKKLKQWKNSLPDVKNAKGE